MIANSEASMGPGSFDPGNKLEMDTKQNRFR